MFRLTITLDNAEQTYSKTVLLSIGRDWLKLRRIQIKLVNLFKEMIGLEDHTEL